MNMDDLHFFDDAAALVDGELDEPALARVLEKLARDPELARQALAARRLKMAVARQMQGQAPALPDALRQRVAALMDDGPMQSQEAVETRRPVATATSANPIGRIGRWAPALVAAMLLLAALIARVAPLATDMPGPGWDSEASYAAVLPASQMSRFASRHERCQFQRQMIREIADFPTQVERAPASIEAIIGSKPHTTLDLSALGYTFWKAGECGIPGGASVHLMYRATDESLPSKWLSLWIVRDEGQLDMEEGITFVATPPNAAHPIIVWRDNGTIYYLVGDAMPVVRQAAVQLAMRR
jgi:hypothetical protein